MPRGRPIGTGRNDEVEPQPVAGVPRCPRELGAVARRKWRELVRVLSPSGLLTLADAGLLQLYVETWSLYCEAVAELQKNGKVLRGERNGGFYQNPWMPIAVASRADLMRLGQMLGLSPAARSRMKIKNRAPRLADDKARFFAKREGMSA